MLSVPSSTWNLFLLHVCPQKPLQICANFILPPYGFQVYSQPDAAITFGSMLQRLARKVNQSAMRTCLVSLTCQDLVASVVTWFWAQLSRPLQTIVPCSAGRFELHAVEQLTSHKFQIDNLPWTSRTLQIVWPVRDCWDCLCLRRLLSATSCFNMHMSQKCRTVLQCAGACWEFCQHFETKHVSAHEPIWDTKPCKHPDIALSKVHIALQPCTVTSEIQLDAPNHATN